ncbi:Uu.00g121500.m01.CDS01 [Anthostomella pinea]|uniref:Uu.00g121500.m01.CDS01 n=1 Tax=Anthostomella pinea TaxID=933095 RepID=A0AAI8YHC1_9PEZI|nr:Uu.00g121500.m01.CDS01 [Anthostomella pinea]
MARSTGLSQAIFAIFAIFASPQLSHYHNFCYGIVALAAVDDMAPSDDENEKLSHADFWNQRYAEAEGDQPTHEWFRSFQDLEAFFDQKLFGTRPPETAPRLLHLGSGDSTVPQELAEKGYNHQLCVDFSAVVVDLMSKRHAEIKGIEWKKLDVRHMDDIPPSSIDVAFDKGTLDAMIHGSPWNPPDDVKKNTSEYLREVFRVLKDDGMFLYVTYRQPHFIRPLLNCEGTDWDIDMDVLGAGDSSFAYHGFALTKRSGAGQ